MSDLKHKPQNEDVQLAQNRSQCWLDEKTKKLIPFSELSPAQLKRAHALCQLKEVEYFNKAGVWGKRADKLEEELERRKIPIKDLKTKFHKNQRHHKKLMKGEIPDHTGQILK